MQAEDNDTFRKLILDFLDMQEIDVSVIGELRRIEGLMDQLTDIAANESVASFHQRKNAIYVMGVLRQKGALPILVSILKDSKSELRSHALLSLSEIGADEEAKALLKNIAVDPDSAPVDVALSIRVLKLTRDSGLIDYFEKNRPSHLEDSGVRESLLYLRAK